MCRIQLSVIYKTLWLSAIQKKYAQYFSKILYIFVLAKSVESINLGSSIKIFDEPVLITKKLTFIDSKVNKSVNQNIMEKISLLEKENSNFPNKENYDKDK